MKVLTIEPPPADPRLREDMALLADCALPPELRVSTRRVGPHVDVAMVDKPRAWLHPWAGASPFL